MPAVAQAPNTATNGPTTTTATTSAHDIAASATYKMERRDSTTSESSLEHLDLGRTPKKLNTLNSATSTPHTNMPLSNMAALSATHALNEFLQHHKLKKTNFDTVTQRHADSDETNDYDEDVDESADEKRVMQSSNATTTAAVTATTLTLPSAASSATNGGHLQQRTPRHHKRRNKRTSVQLEYNADNPNSLRKKFRFNRSVADSTASTVYNESGFVDASTNSSQFLNASGQGHTSASTHTNSSSNSAGSSPQATAASSPESGIEREREDMKYFCPICEEVSSTQHEFTNHIRWHNNASGDIENFTCRICSKVLSSASSLDRHVLVHTGERPFNCKYCHLKFTTNGNMHRHMRTHKQHQHNYHQRRNSNGTTKNNHSNNNNNNNNATNNNSSSSNNNITNLIITATATTAAAAAATSITSSANATTNCDAIANGITAATTTTITGVNQKHLNGCNIGGMESYDSDGGCSTDSSTNNSQSSKNNQHHHHQSHSNNNNSSNHNNNNESQNNCQRFNNDSNNNSNGSHYERDANDVDADGDGGDNANITALLKRRVKTTINNNNISIVDQKQQQPQPPPQHFQLSCPVCDAHEFANMLELGAHLDSEHPDIPAKCRHCDTVFRTHRQLNVHPCSHSESAEFNKDQRQQRSLSESSNPDNRDEVERDIFFRNFLNSKLHEQQQHGSSPLHAAEAPYAQLNQSIDSIKLECDAEPASTDSKDFADIQSILNMTSTSSTSNFLKNFEQAVNTPSSQYSMDRDEEEAQDAFSSEFRKMKLRGEFPCKLCTAIFPNLRALKGHNRIHLATVGPAGPFRCNVCPYSICDKATLVRHMRSHNGDRPYECAICNYAFTTKANCERHIRNRHAKTTREEVKRDIIYHPSEDYTCDENAKKLLYASPDFDDECDLSSSYGAHHQPKDRSTPVSHLKEILSGGESNSATKNSPPLKIQVKSLEKLLDNPEANTFNQTPKIGSETSAPIDLSMEVLDLSKKPTIKSALPKANEETPQAMLAAVAPASVNNDPATVSSAMDFAPNLKKIQQDLLEFATRDYSKMGLNNNEELLMDLLLRQQAQKIYNPLFPPFNPFLMPNNFKEMPLMPLMSHMLAAAMPQLPTTLNDAKKQMQMPDLTAAANTACSLSNNPNEMLPQMSPMVADATASQMLPKSLASPSASMHSNSNNTHNSPRQANNYPVKMVIKNGVLMPKQKQRRYRTERPFACEHCSARFTLRSNMERHVKQQHPQFYAQRQRNGHHVMRGRGASSAAAMNSITHLQAALAQAHSNSNSGSAQAPSPSPISDQVKYAILAQQLKARKDTDLLQQALAHGSSSVAPNHFLLGGSGNAAMQQFANSANINFNPFNLNNSSMQNNASSLMEDDEPKLVIDEDEEEDDDDVSEVPLEISLTEVNEEHEEDEARTKFNENEETAEVNDDLESVKEQGPQLEDETEKDAAAKHLPEANETAKKEAEIILEQARKTKSTDEHEAASKLKTGTDSITEPAAPPPTATTMKSMIAQAESVGKFLKEVASSPFKDDSQDLVSVSKLVDNATSNSVSFNNYFRPSDVVNHMEQSDEEGLVASGSASESNNSGAEDVTSAMEPKKKSAYSLAPNRVSCPYCQRMFPWSSSLRRHILTHTGQKPFKCSHCPLLFTTKSNCDRHLLRKHGNVESAMSVYVPSEDVTEPIPVPKSVEEIEQQQRQREEEERKRKAEEAKQERERLRELERQEQQQQQQQQQLLKQLAAAQFQSFNNANSSSGSTMKMDGTNNPAAAVANGGLSANSTDLPFKCHLCENNFAERLQCLEHIKNQHTTEFSLLLAKGAIDTDADAQQLQLDEEERLARGLQEDSLAARALSGGKYPDYTNRKVICAFCLRRFWSTEDLRRHMRTHSGERPFQCEICLRKFTLKHSMLRHMKKHNGRLSNGGLNANGSDQNGGNNSGSDFSDDEQTTATPSNAMALLMRAPKIQELLNKANEWRNGSHMASEQKENIASVDEAQSPNDLIGNLLGISDQGILNKLLSSADEAAKLLGVDK